MKQKYTYIPFGSRCSAATILKENLGKRVQALPFDWIDIPMRSLEMFIPDSREDIETHVEKYLSRIKNQRHTEDETWFVHDFPKGRKETVEEYEKIKAKYIRRFNRLFDILEDESEIVFITVITHIDEKNIIPYKRAISKLILKTSKPVYTIVINLIDREYVYGEVNLVVKFDEDWEKFHEEIANRLLTDPNTKDFF